ncbi:putative disabled-like 2-interacting protein [Apostichopus japonicus]|uniref:Putative disabled-like 2-interacting protein n=1 Tax=Stichopus japonicus TaxID=307972 RepID=A0A2G8JN26_STIJA|nr:putative disabled-like 2-interacting protein [Apostichopus japonicus]
MATKSMEAYLKLIGAKYLQDTLGDFIQYLYDKDGDCEPLKPSHHQSDLTMLCEMVCCKILNSPASFPAEIRAVFQEFRKQFGDRTNGNNLCNKLISGCIFLRFLCPAVMSPSLFNLVQEFPSDKTSRCLTLIAKTTQALANFTKFGAKESYMVFMNEFLEREWGNMNAFLKEISTYEDGCHLVKFDGYIDLGRELSLLHTLLSEALSNCEKAPEDKLSGLKDILANISGYLDEPGEFISYQPDRCGSAVASPPPVLPTCRPTSRRYLRIVRTGKTETSRCYPRTTSRWTGPSRPRPRSTASWISFRKTARRLSALTWRVITEWSIPVIFVRRRITVKWKSIKQNP